MTPVLICDVEEGPKRFAAQQADYREFERYQQPDGSVLTLWVRRDLLD